MNYDAQQDPEALVKRMVYGMPPPLLGDGSRMDAVFYGRLFDAMANGHGAYVKACRTKGNAYWVAKVLRKEIPRELYEVQCKNFEPDFGGWHVFVYNHRYAEAVFQLPIMYRVGLPSAEWVDTREAARILNVQRRYVPVLARQYNLKPAIFGGRRVHYFRRTDILILANRPGRHKKKRQPRDQSS